MRMFTRTVKGMSGEKEPTKLGAYMLYTASY